MSSMSSRKVKRPKFHEPDPGIDYDRPIGPVRHNPNQYKEPIGPKPASGAERIKQSVVDWGRRGMQNFIENASRPVARQERSFEGVSKKARGRQPRQREPPMFNIPREQGLDIDLSQLGGGLDMSLHPDPMYSGMAPRRRKHGGPDGEPKSVTVTTKTYRY